ncbi:unnamed protein product, partial [Phaeothamnion confervicola]
QECTTAEYNAGDCPASDYVSAQHRLIYTLIVTCTDDEISAGTCQDNPEADLMWNPCLTGEMKVEVTNGGEIYSGDGLTYDHTSYTALDSSVYNNYLDYTVQPTFAIFTAVAAAYWPDDEGAGGSSSSGSYSSGGSSYSGYANSSTSSSGLFAADVARCLVARQSEEGARGREEGWYGLRALQTALFTYDFSHIPEGMVYGEHYRIAIYVTPSRCTDELCNTNRVRLAAAETLPCRQPLDLPSAFTDTSVPKHQVLNLTVFSLEDVLVKTEVHVMHGLYLPAAPLFQNTTAVDVIRPSRAKIDLGTVPATRQLSPFLSFEERHVAEEHFFVALYYYSNVDDHAAPLNLPPRYAAYTKGRVLVGFNTSSENDATPWIADAQVTCFWWRRKTSRRKWNVSEDVEPASDYWDMPGATVEATKEMKDTFDEIFDHMTYADGTFTYDFTQMLLPYLPFFSSCRGFDSYVPIYALLESESCALPTVDDGYSSSWWRRDYDVFPAQDDVKYVGPWDVSGVPIADWCELSIDCQYEETLDSVEVVPRWFEAATGDTLFHIVRQPVTWLEFTGRATERVSADDHGTSQLATWLVKNEGSDVLIPVEVDRTAADYFSGGCTELCYPRSMALEISYYQIDKHEKRIVSATLVYDSFDKDSTSLGYALSLSFFPLTYWQLISSFAFTRGVFIVLFLCIGAIAVLVNAVLWVQVRLTTRLVNPPRLRFVGMYSLIGPPVAAGAILGLIPVAVLTTALSLLVNGYGTSASEGTLVLDSWRLHYMDSDVDPDNLEMARIGRLGLGFVCIGAVCIWQGAKIFLPPRQSKREKDLELRRDRRAEKTHVWQSLQWRRSNMVLTSYLMGFFCLFIVEFSLWGSFSDYYWYVFVAYQVIGMLAASAVDKAMREALLAAPITAALSLVMGVTTLGASNFLDFLWGFCVGLGLTMLFRVYIDPGLNKFLLSLRAWGTHAAQQMRMRLPRRVKTRFGILADGSWGGSGAVAAARAAAGGIAGGSGGTEGGETVEPILVAFGTYSTETLSLFLSPGVIVLFMVFRTEMALPALYGIKEQDMEYYLWFALIIIIFQLACDVFLHGTCELFHGWKVYDYLVYTRYRFLQRETRWKGLEDSLDECIDESMRTLDQMCFSSQYYMMMAVHVCGILYFVLGAQMMLRQNYNMWGDPAALLLVPFVLAAALVTAWLLLWLALKVNLWRIKHEHTAWHSNVDGDDDLDIPDMEDLKGASHDAFLMNQRITSDTFRYKFLNYNRTWLIGQLPSILTPRTLRRSRPYLINQFARILNQLNRDVSSDSEDEGPDFGPVALTASSRNMVRWWLTQARKRLRLREVVQPLMNKARGTHCEQCLSRKQLQVQLVTPLEDLGRQFEEEHPEDEFDQAAWKRFWMQHQRYETICLKCLGKAKEVLRSAVASGSASGGGGGGGVGSDDDGDNGAGDGAGGVNFGPVYLTAASRAILARWYGQAQENVWGKRGRRRPRQHVPAATRTAEVSDDEGDGGEDGPAVWARDPVNLTPASQALAVRWLRTARAKLQQRAAGGATGTGKPRDGRGGGRDGRSRRK